VEIDAAATQQRIALLRRYVAGHLLREETFICPHFAECRRSRRPGDTFREGIMSHVGKRFDLRIEGRPLRIVVVGQESGWSKGPGAQKRRRLVSLDARYHAVHIDCDRWITVVDRECPRPRSILELVAEELKA
jgi:hypothetical protein